MGVLTAGAMSAILTSELEELQAETLSDQGKFIVYVGVYGKGIYAYRFDPATAKLDSLGMVGPVVNPSFLATDREFRYLYAVSEVEGNTNGGVAAFAIDRKSGSLRPLNNIGSGGVAPCHLAVDKTGKMLVVANYTSGGVSAYPLKPDGSIGIMSALMEAHGSGPNKERQEGPHAHETVITSDNKRVYVPDLGLDQIRIYRIDAATAHIAPNDPPFAKQESGYGPRHMAFDAKERHAYVINELRSVVTVFSRDHSNGALVRLQDIPTIPDDFKGENSPAELVIDRAGRFVYTTNRGHDSIAVFGIDKNTAKLHQVQIISSEGKQPRGFTIDPTGQYAFAGNQTTNSFQIFRIDAETGKLSPVGVPVEVSSPVDFHFVPA